MTFVVDKANITALLFNKGKMETEERSKTQDGQNQDKKAEKTWHEKLVDSISGNTELLKSLIGFLSNPFVLAGGMVAFVCWIFKSKENKETLDLRNRELQFELGVLYKKYKKIKKKYKRMEENFSTENTKQNFNFFKRDEKSEKNKPNQNNSGSIFLS